MKFFNTAGPVKCDDHYNAPPLTRLDLEKILMLIGQTKYFTIHAPWNTGKTTCLLELMKYLNSAGQYKCLYFSAAVAQWTGEDVHRGVKALLLEMAKRARLHLEDFTPHEIWRGILDKKGEHTALNEVFSKWSMKSDKPLVLLIDDIDPSIGDTVNSMLRQIRAGYDKRPDYFPQSIILCGEKDVKDQPIYSGKNKLTVGGSGFNIKAESIRLADFSREEVEALYHCHTAETGQTFTEGAMNAVWELSEGQPWVVNALGYEVCFDMRKNRDRAIVITGEMVREAGEILIRKREIHIDRLARKLKDERARRIIEPMISGEDMGLMINPDDIQYVLDPGLIRRDRGFRPANGLYREMIPRQITFVQQLNFGSTHPPDQYYHKETGMLDMTRALSAFQEFFRNNSEHWLERFQYKEAGPQLLMQAFFQNIVNGRGRVEREYGFGRERVDLLVVASGGPDAQKVVIELKIRHGDTDKAIAKGLKQTWEYMDKCGAKHGHLVIFDKRKNTSWEEKIFRREEEYNGDKIMVWGM